MCSFFKFFNILFLKLSRHLQFLFFDGEEAFKEWTATDSIYGARSHAEDLSRSFGDVAFDRIDLFVLLDLLGGKVSQFPNYFPATSNTYRMLARIGLFFKFWNITIF